MGELARDYPLGHSGSELDRLALQASLVDPITRRYFENGGLKKGMRVLDVGSGAGHTSFLAAEIVGSDGHVTGIDNSAKAVETATEGALERGLSQVEFHVGDPAAMTFAEPFDALVGRYVLVFQSNPGAWLEPLARRVKPGGLVVFHEPDMASASSSPPAPAYDRCCFLLLEAFGRNHMIHRLRSVFTSAGLAPPTMELQIIYGGAPQITPWLDLAGQMLASLTPTLEKLGAATSVEVDYLRRKMLDVGDSTILGRAEIGAWTRTAATL